MWKTACHREMRLKIASLVLMATALRGSESARVPVHGRGRTASEEASDAAPEILLPGQQQGPGSAMPPRTSGPSINAELDDQDAPPPPPWSFGFDGAADSLAAGMEDATSGRLERFTESFATVAAKQWPWFMLGCSTILLAFVLGMPAEDDDPCYLL